MGQNKNTEQNICPLMCDVRASSGSIANLSYVGTGIGDLVGSL